MRWWRVLFPESPTRVAAREAAMKASGLTPAAEFAAIEQRHNALAARVDELEARVELLVGAEQKEGPDATGTTE